MGIKIFLESIPVSGWLTITYTQIFSIKSKLNVIPHSTSTQMQKYGCCRSNPYLKQRGVCMKERKVAWKGIVVLDKLWKGPMKARDFESLTFFTSHVIAPVGGSPEERRGLSPQHRGF